MKKSSGKKGKGSKIKANVFSSLMSNIEKINQISNIKQDNYLVHGLIHSYPETDDVDIN